MRNFFGLIGQVLCGLRFRLLLLVLLVCAPLVGLVLHSAGEDRRRAVNNWRQRSQRMLQTARREEQQVVTATRQLLFAISESADVASLNPRRCTTFLNEMFVDNSRYANMGVLSTNGDVLASHQALPKTANLAQCDFFRSALEGRSFSIGEFPARSSHGRPTLSFGYPVLDGYGQVQAVVFAELDLYWLNRFGSDVPNQLPRGATWTEIDSDGKILARYPGPENWIGHRLPEKALLPSIFNEPSGVGETLNAQGIPCFFAFASMPSQLVAGDVAAILGIPKHMLFGEADRLLRRNLTWLSVAAAFALVLGWMASKLLILRPVRRLVQASLRLAAGDFSARTGLVHSRDELGQMTLAFDQMAHTLEQRELERQRASQKLQVLSHRLVEVQETERRHIARELHDEIGQSLTAAEMNLQAALRLPGAPAIERRLEDSIRAVERVLEQVHDLSLNLRPSMLDDLGLEPALRWYTHRQAALTGLRADFRADPLEDRLDPMIETECFRVAQEALTNVVRHAKARSVKVELSRRGDRLYLLVRDDGVGFDVSALRDEAVHGASLGLLSMEERTALAGGGLEFISGPDAGTEIHAWFPLKWKHSLTWSEANESWSEANE